LTKNARIKADFFNDCLTTNTIVFLDTARINQLKHIMGVSKNSKFQTENEQQSVVTKSGFLEMPLYFSHRKLDINILLSFITARTLQ